MSNVWKYILSVEHRSKTNLSDWNMKQSLKLNEIGGEGSPQTPSFLMAKWPQVRTRSCLSGFFPASNLAPATDEKWGIVRNPHTYPVNIRDILQVSSILVRLRLVHFSHAIHCMFLPIPGQSRSQKLGEPIVKTNSASFHGVSKVKI